MSGRVHSQQRLDRKKAVGGISIPLIRKAGRDGAYFISPKFEFKVDLVDSIIMVFPPKDGKGATLCVRPRVGAVQRMLDDVEEQESFEASLHSGRQHDDTDDHDED